MGMHLIIRVVITVCQGNFSDRTSGTYAVHVCNQMIKINRGMPPLTLFQYVTATTVFDVVLFECTQ
jgi:hypothetical protein